MGGARCTRFGFNETRRNPRPAVRRAAHHHVVEEANQMPTTLEGSTALVTGATAGIGRAVALQLARLGADVVVHGRSAERGEKVVQEIQNDGGKARFVSADLADPDDVRRLAAKV